MAAFILVLLGCAFLGAGIGAALTRAIGIRGFLVCWAAAVVCAALACAVRTS